MLFHLFMIIWKIADKLDAFADAINSAFHCASYRRYHNR